MRARATLTLLCALIAMLLLTSCSRPTRADDPALPRDLLERNEHVWLCSQRHEGALIEGFTVDDCFSVPLADLVNE